MFGVIVISVIHGVVATSIVYLIGVDHRGRPLGITTIAAGFVGLFAIVLVLILIHGLFLTMRRAKTQVVGKSVSRSTCPKLWKYVSDLANKVGALSPDNLIVGLTPTFFVTEADVARFGGVLKGRTLFISLPLCRIYSEPEFRGILSHELGHFRGEDTKFSQKFFPFYRGVSSALEGSQSLVFFPAYAILNYFIECFASQMGEFRRERELLADQVGAEVAGQANVATALLKIHAFEHYWADTYRRMGETLSVGGQVVNFSQLFATRVAEEASSSHFTGLDDKRLAHPTDTHPSFGTRLEGLGIAMPDVTHAALAVTPSISAVELVDDFETIEIELTKLETNFLVKTGQVIVARLVGCPSCGRSNSLETGACECGFNFRRSGLR